MDDITRTPEHEAISALRPFAMYADSMRSLHDDDRIGGVYVRHFREAARVVNEYDAVCFGCAPSDAVGHRSPESYEGQIKAQHQVIAKLQAKAKRWQEIALKLAGAECFIEEQRKKGNIK